MEFGSIQRDVRQGCVISHYISGKVLTEVRNGFDVNGKVINI